MMKVAEKSPPVVEWSLTDPGMSFLERAGLAGLYMSLTAADEWANQKDSQAEELKQKLSWELSDRSVRLSWEGDDLEVLSKLVKWAWQIKDKVYYMPGVHRGTDLREHSFLRIQTHTGLLGTFLQFSGQLRPKVEQSVAMPISFDANDPSKTVAVYYRPIKQGEEVRQVGLIKGKLSPLCDQSGALRTVSLPGWVYPGAAKRFGKDDQDWTGTTDKALLLLFAPVACFFMGLPPTKAKKRMRDNWAFVIPEITSLGEAAEKYHDLQTKLQNRLDDVKASGLGDAGLRFAVAYAGRPIEKLLTSPKIFVTAMGVVDYYSSIPTVTRSIRRNVIQLSPSATSIKRYRRLMARLPNVFFPLKADTETQDSEVEEEEGQAIRTTHWIRQPSARGRIAENLVNSLPWYLDLLWPTDWQIDALENQRKRLSDNISTERLWFDNLRREWRALMELTKDETMWDRPEEQAFASIVNGTLRRLLNQEEEALSRGGSRNLAKRWDVKVEKIRRALMRSKTRELNRAFFAEFFSEAGGSKDLTQSKEQVWRLINHPLDWKKARDLALLSLVTFTDKRLSPKTEKAEGKSNE